KMRICGLRPGRYGLTSQDCLKVSNDNMAQMVQHPDQLQGNWLRQCSLTHYS
ncbi:hypothetical protein STEG23_028328, partial [Scotinomys teguina]